MIIGISGRARAGKDTAANYLVNNELAVRRGLADPIKEGLSKMTGYPLHYFYDADKKNKILPEYGVTPTELCICVGTDWAQYDIHSQMYRYTKKDTIPTLGRNFWLHSLCRWIKECDSKRPYIVIPDVRFPHEINFLKDRYKDQIIFIRMNRIIPTTGKQYIENSSRKYHESETALDYWDNWDHVINASSVESIHEQMKKITQEIK